jgi:hypothetical protein
MRGAEGGWAIRPTYEGTQHGCHRTLAATLATPDDGVDMNPGRTAVAYLFGLLAVVVIVIAWWIGMIAMVKRSIAWIVTNGHRRVRYRGVEANRAQLALRVAAINLRRLVNLGLTHNGEAWAIT